MTEKRLSFTKKRKLRTYDKLVHARVPFKKSVQIKVMFDTHHITITEVFAKKKIQKYLRLVFTFHLVQLRTHTSGFMREIEHGEDRSRLWQASMLSPAVIKHLSY